METLEERLRSYLSRAAYRPQDRSAIARGMAVSSAERAELRALISRWEAEKKLLRLRGACYALTAAVQALYTGVVRVLPRGKKLFVPYEEGQRALEHLSERAGVVELPIAPGRSMGALEGDVVRAKVVRSYPPGYYRRRGKKASSREAHVSLTAQVESVLERRHELWVGTLYRQGKQLLVHGDGKSSPARICLSAPAPPDAQPGMLVTVRPESVSAGASEARGRVVELLGWPEDPGVDMAALIRRYALRESFSDEALTEAQLLAAGLSAADKAAREDWSARCVVTVDPPDARDFDDAISVSRLPGDEGWELAVHIADVSFYVRPGSALDTEARRRGNSTYLPDRVLPMLPPRLCDDLCSLVQDEERATLLCHMRISSRGEVSSARLARAFIRSRRRLDYPTVLALLQDGVSVGDAGVDAMLREASALAQLLRRKRFESGALNLDMPEIRAVLDAQGRTIGFRKEESDISHQLIEEFMLAANEQVARMLRERMLPAIYRVHEEPAADKWSDFAHTLREYGISASTLMSRKELMKIMESIAAHPEEEQLKLAMLRSMMRARYAPQPLGHFGLAKADYCHFTSPIRRYADLVVHRAVGRMLRFPGATDMPTPGELSRLAEHLSETERRSAAAEAEALRLKIFQYMEEQSQATEPACWQAVVCGVWAHGLAVELCELHLRGYVPASLLPRRQGWFYASGHEWRSRAGVSLQQGSRLSVVPYAVDWTSQSIDFRPAALDELAGEGVWEEKER